MSLRARFLWVFIVALAVAALSATAALAMPSLGDLSWDIFGASLTFAGCLFGSMLCAIVLERHDSRVPMLLAIAGWALTCLLSWALIWYPYSTTGAWDAEEIVGKSVLSASLVSGALTAIGLLGLLRPRGRMVGLVRTTTATVCWSFVVLSILILWEIIESWWLFPSDLTMRVWSGLFILSITGLLGTPALRAVEIARRKDAAESGLPIRVTVRLTCPRCGTEQSITTGGAMCAQCGLSIKVEVEEPLCPACGYSLARLDADVCPECGNAIQDNPRFCGVRARSDGPEIAKNDESIG